MKAKVWKADGRWPLLTALVVAVAVFCYWYFLYPYVLAARESALLFLWTGDYLLERLSLPGGLARWLGELVTQFFCFRLYGSLLYVALCLTGWWLAWRLMGRVRWLSGGRVRWLSLLVPVVICLLGRHYYVPLTPVVAVLLTLGVLLLLPASAKVRPWAALALTPVLYWLVGPAAVLLVLGCRRFYVWAVQLLVLCVCVLASQYVTPYPLGQLYAGLDYHWTAPQPNADEEMECDWLLRLRRYDAIASRFSLSSSPAVQNAVQLSLFQLGRISQADLSSRVNLSATALRSQASVFLMSEVYILLGAVNMSQRCVFEAMELTPNHGKSARALRRLAETNLVTDHPDVTLKYLSLLSETACYCDFARKLRPLAEHPEMLTNHPYYEQLRQVYHNSSDAFFY